MQKSLFITGLALLVGCSPSNGSEPAVINVGGSAETYEMLEILAEPFTQETGIRFHFDDHSQTGGGLAGLDNGDYDLAAVSQDLFTHTQLDGKQHHAIAHVPLVFVASPETGVSDLSVEQIRAIYSGAINNWSQLGGVAEPIQLIILDESESEMQEFRAMILNDQAISDQALTVDDEDELIATVSFYTYGLTLAPLEEDIAEAGLNVLTIDGIDPSGEYLLDIPLGVVRENRVPHHVQQFLDFAESDRAAEILEAVGYLPLEG